MSDDNIREHETNDESVSSVADIQRIWAEAQTKLDNLVGDIKTNEELYHAAVSDKTTEIAEIEKQRHEAIERVKSEFADRLAEATRRLDAPVEEARAAAQNGVNAYKDAIDDAIATGVITKDGLAALGHTKPKGRYTL